MPSALAVGVDLRLGEAGIGAQLDDHLRPARPQPRTSRCRMARTPAPAWACAGAQDGGDELPGVAVEDQQRVVHVLAVVAVVGAAFLLPVRRVVGAVQVEHDVRPARRRAPAPPDRPPPAPPPSDSSPVPRPRSPAARRSAGWPGRDRCPASGRRPASAGDRGARCRHRPGPRSRRRSDRCAAAAAPATCAARGAGADPGRPPPGRHRAPARCPLRPPNSSPHRWSAGPRESRPPTAARPAGQSAARVWQTGTCGAPPLGSGWSALLPIPDRCLAVTDE